MARLALVGIGILVAVLTLGSIAPGLAPVIVTSPVSGSMSPTAETHSLVILTDTNPAVGDIAMFQTPSRETPVLHRLVSTTADSETFLTRGDANPFTDQETGDPPVPRSLIYGTVPTIAGNPLIIPYAGIVLTNPVVRFGVWILLGLSLLYSTSGGQTIRETVATVPVRMHFIGLAFLIMLLLPAVTILSPATVTTEILTTTTAPEDTPHLVRPGEIGERTVDVASPVIWGLRTVPYVDGDLRLESVERLPDDGRQRITVVNEPSDVPKVHKGTVTVYSYPAILPSSWFLALADIHPALAAFAASLPLGSAVVVFALLFIDPHRPLRASKQAIYARRRDDRSEKKYVE